MVDIPSNSLVLLKTKPARVIRVADKVELDLGKGKTAKVRLKDVILLHPGPLQSLDELRTLAGEVEIAWEIMAGETTGLLELAELIYDQITPSTAWSTWEYVTEGLYFHGTDPSEIHVRDTEELEKERAAREAKDADERAWTDFIGRVRQGAVLPAEVENLAGVEALAYGRTSQSRVLRELGRGPTPETAHALLLKLGQWDETKNPYPKRFELPESTPDHDVPDLPEEEREDLTHLPAFAIDDEGNQDPDDAISIDGDYLWIHVADAAALAPPRSHLDQEARARAANVYLPETTIPMLPPAATHKLGLGLSETSPALSFRVKLTEDGDIEDVHIVRSMVKVTRLSYAEADTQLDQSPLAEILAYTGRFNKARINNGCISIDLPEVKIRVQEGEVVISPLPRLRSRNMVTEAMLMAGEAAARFALEKQIPFPFTTQAPPETSQRPTDMAGQFAFRKHLKRSFTKTSPDPHTGLGLELYTRATSPLRRYLDLVAHQQIRAFLRDEELLSPQEITERVGATEAMFDSLRRTERFSNKHWSLVYLMHNPEWQGEGVVVEQRGKRATVIIPDLGLESSLQLEDMPDLNGRINLAVKKVDLPELSVRFIAI